jgi:ferredoxin-NADP reductase/DMSO/TMAO reductase YedYZ heme-binding membrane subunit
VRAFDVRLLRRLALVNAAVPAMLFAWDALNGDLGANGVNYAIHTTGALGLLFLVLSLAVTPLRRISGRAELIAPRRTLGLFAFFYLCLHFFIFFAFDRAGSVTSTAHEIVTRKYLWIGTAGLALMIPLAVTSTDGMITRLGPRRWKRLHRAVYACALLGAVHYVMLVKSDVRKPVAFLAAVGVLLAFRIGARAFDARRKKSRSDARAGAAAPAGVTKRRFWKGELVVVKTFDETPDVRTFRFALPGGGPLPFEHAPGQYLTLTRTSEGRRMIRSYTISSSPSHREHVDITVKRVPSGACSNHLHATLREGERIAIAAPAGRFTFTGEEAERVTLIAGGVGITPLMAIVRRLAERAWSGDVRLIFAVRTERDIVFRDELRALEKTFPRLTVCITLTGEAGSATDPWQGKRGRITKDMLVSFAPDVARGHVYLCGPDAMMKSTKAMLRELGVPDAQVRTEEFVSGSTVRVEETAQADVAPDVAPDASDGEREIVVRFARSGKSLPLAADLTILEAGEDAGLDLAFDCRSGICGQCKTRLLDGDVTMDVEDALSANDRATGVILACQARAKTNVVIDA